MQSLFRLLSVIALSAVMIAPAAAFQDCCCVEADQTGELRSCCARAKRLAEAASEPQQDVPSESRGGHRCPCVKQQQPKAVQAERVESSQTQQEPVVVLTPQESVVSELTVVVPVEARRTGPPLRVAHSVWRL